MNIQTNSHPLQATFDNLLADYPELGRFCHKVREEAKTKRALADEMAKLCNTLDRPETKSQAKQIPHIARKFKKIVIAIDKNSESVSVEEKVQGLLRELRNAEAPNSPSIQELKPFLEALQGAPVGCALKRFRNFFTASQVTSHFSKCIEAEKDLLKYDAALKADALLSLKDPTSFAKNIKALHLLNLLDDEVRTLLRTHSNPDHFVEHLLLKKWNEEIVAKNGEIELIKDLPGQHHSSDPRLILLKRVLCIESEWNALIEKFRGHPGILARLMPLISEGKVESSWNEIISQDLEINILEHIEDIDGNLLLNLDRTRHILEKYKNNPKALAVIIRFANHEETRYIWDHLIIPNQREIEFLSEVNKPGAASNLDVRSKLFPQQSEELTALINKYEQNGGALAVIFKVLIPYQKTKLWDEVIVENKLQIPFLSQVGMPGAAKLVDLGFLRHPSSERCEALIKQNKLDAAKLAVIFKILIRNKQTKVWDEVIVENKLEIPFLSYLDPKLIEPLRDILETKKQESSKYNRREELILQHNNDPEALALFNLLGIVN